MSDLKIVYDDLLFETGAGLVMGKEAKLWRVLEVDHSLRKALLVMEDLLESKPFAAKWSESAAYEESEIHYDLEQLFYPHFFTEQEKDAILESEISVRDYDDPFWNESVKAHVFSLSVQEVNACYQVTMFFEHGSGWWLRDHRQDDESALYISSSGSIGMSGRDILKPLSVRPAFWLDLDSDYFRALIVKEEEGMILYHGPCYAVKEDRLCFVSCTTEHLALGKEVKKVGPVAIRNCAHLKSIRLEDPDTYFTPGSIYNCPSLRLSSSFFEGDKNLSGSFYPYYPDDVSLVQKALLRKAASAWFRDERGYETLITLLDALSPASMKEMLNQWPEDKEDMLPALALIPYFQDLRQIMQSDFSKAMSRKKLPRYIKADLAAAKCDHKRLMLKLEEMSQKNSLWLAVWPVYAVESDMDQGFKKIQIRLIRDAAEDRTNYTEELSRLFWRQMLQSNHTICGLRLLDHQDLLEQRAEMINADPDALRKEYLSDLSMDPKGCKTVQLGARKWVVKADRYMNLVYFLDDLDGQTYDHLPEEGVRQHEYKSVTVGLKIYQQKLRDTMDTLKIVLLREFLSGYGRDPEQWKELFIEEPFMRLLATRLVFVQKGHCFTVTDDGGLIDVSGKEYQLSSEGISLAHPMEMENEDVILWRRYFATATIKPLFMQMDEPLFEPASLTGDRYQGYKIPDHTFRRKEAEGISFYHRTPIFKNCRIKYQKERDFTIIEKFSFACYDRQVNHIVGVLEMICAADRVKNNDARVIALLPYCEKTQLQKMFEIAQEHAHTVLIAALMEQLNQIKDEDEALRTLQL